MLTIAVLSIFVLACLGGSSLVKADKKQIYAKSFTSIEVQTGDTLSSIASTYADSPAHYNDYIEEVISINNLKDDTIHAGCYLMVPVYELKNNSTE